MRPICRLLGTTSILALAVATTTLSAQAKDETLLHGGTGSVGFYITPVVKLTEVNSRGAVLGGIRAGVLFARRFGVGLARYAGGQHRFSDYDFRGGPGVPERYPRGRNGYGHDEQELSYGGVEVEYLWQPSKVVHATVSTLIGGGSLASDIVYAVPPPNNGGMSRMDYGSGNREGFFVAEPAVHAEINLATHVRLAVGMGYRFSAGGDQYRFTSSNARGATGSFAIKFGKL